MKKAYKGFNVNSNNELYCRDFIFEVGKDYKIDGEIELCKRGFHFCWNLNDVNFFYNLKTSVICEVEILGNIKNEVNMSKSVTDHIKIIRVLKSEDVLIISNIGKNNTGYLNSGNDNSGNYNSGDYNSGHRNSGNRNSGNDNSGNDNSGNDNSGNDNSGNYNSGNDNSGNYNSGNYNSGFFNINKNKCFIFDTLSNLTVSEFIDSKYYEALISETIILNQWINFTKEEKEIDKAKELIGGYFKMYEHKEAYKLWWGKLTEQNKEIIQEIPNFCKDKFFKITGIEI